MQVPPGNWFIGMIRFEGVRYLQTVPNPKRVVTMPAGPASRPWRRYLRLSVRGLIVLVLVIGVWLGWIVRSARIQREAVAAITRAGGHVSYDWEWRNGRYFAEPKPWAPQWLVDRVGVDLFGHVVAASPSQARGQAIRRLAHVGRFTRLESLSIYSSSVTDQGLAHFEGLTRLSEINLCNTQVTDDGLKHLEGLKGLSSLVINATRISDDGLKHLSRLTKLSILYIGDSENR